MLAVNRYRLGALGLALALSGVGGSALAQAQGGPPVSQAVVQPLPGKDGRALDSALARLAREPRDIAALIDAGNAALTLGDYDAATGFFRRADQVSPNNPRVQAGLAGAMVQSGDPFSAIPLFEQAEKGGVLDATGAADRGLAYDLVGDTTTAQRYYRQSIARMPSEEAARRLALSYAIAGDRQAVETTLSPLLGQRNMAAWRTRAFALAILGQTEEAVNIANSILPADLAASIAPYLRYMPRLTRAQQAAAANFGAFPRASEIGRDDPRVAEFAPRRPVVAAVDAPLTPRGEPLGRNARKRDRDRQREQQRLASAQIDPRRPPAGATTTASPTASQRRDERDARAAPGEPPQPTRETSVAVVTARTPTPATMPAPARAVAPPPVAAAPTPTPPPPTQPAPASSPSATPAPAFASGQPSGVIPVPGFSLTPAAPPSVPPPAPLPRRSLADVFAEFGRPSTDEAPAPGAVDLRGLKLEPKRIAEAKKSAVDAERSVATTPGAPHVEVRRDTKKSAAETDDAAPAAAAATPRADARRGAKKGAAEADAADAPAAGIPRADAKKDARKKPAEPAKPSHPSRIWVQVATGRDKAALGFDWRRMTREKAEAFRGKQPLISAWGQTNRLLTGPFQSEAAANSFVAQLRKADVDGAFVWTSPAGQVVDALSAAAAARR